MSSVTRLQTQIETKLKETLEDYFEREGLSLNDGVRLLLTQYAKGNIMINISAPNYTASDRTIKKALDDISNSVTLEDIDDLDKL